MSTKDFVASAAGLVTIAGFLFPWTKEIVSTTMPIPVGVIAFVVVGIWWVFETGKRIGKGKVAEPATPLPVRDTKLELSYKTELIEFVDAGVQYAVEVPIGKDNVETRLKVSSPRCLTHPVAMKKKALGYGSRGPMTWVCAACKHSISDEKNESLEVLAKTEVLNRYAVTSAIS